MNLEDKIKNKIVELKKEDQEDLEFTKKHFPHWTEKQCIAVHEQENWTQFLIEELEKILK